MTGKRSVFPTSNPRDGIAELLRDDIRYVRVADKAPEQWDAFIDDMQVAHIRLRAGHLTVRSPNRDGKAVLSIRMDDARDRFDSAQQRSEHLRICHHVITTHQAVAPVAATSVTIPAP